MNEKMLLKEIVKLFTDNISLREYCGITDLEVEMCRKVLIEDKLFSELEIPGKIKRSQVKKMVSAPFLKVIYKLNRQIDKSKHTIKANANYDNNFEEEEEEEVNLKRELEVMTIDDISISERTRKVLAENGITNINEIAELNFDELKLTGNYGVKTIFELQQLAGKLNDSRDILSILRKKGK
jgi:hypothetical protein